MWRSEIGGEMVPRFHSATPRGNTGWGSVPHKGSFVRLCEFAFTQSHERRLGSDKPVQIDLVGGPSLSTGPVFRTNRYQDHERAPPYPCARATASAHVRK